ncbi:hypothetical protein ACTXT7_002022 [Hymenolepis weldensis]
MNWNVMSIAVMIECEMLCYRSIWFAFNRSEQVGRIGVAEANGKDHLYCRPRGTEEMEQRLQKATDRKREYMRLSAIPQSIPIISYPSSLRQQARGERDHWLESFIKYRAQMGEREAVLEVDAVRVHIVVYIGDKFSQSLVNREPQYQETKCTERYNNTARDHSPVVNLNEKTPPIVLQ